MLHKPIHTESDLRSYEKGANQDDNEEIVGLKQGEYIDARNMRNTDVDGNQNVLQKILGEEILYPNIDNRCGSGTGLPIPNPSRYECMLEAFINGFHIEFWSSIVPTDEPFIRINGQICLRNINFPVRPDNPVQFAKDENCNGGELYWTDNFHPPMFLNITDVWDNRCENKYFEDYTVSLTTLQLSKPLDMPRFIELVDVGLGGGLPAGEYQYSIRYSTSDGANLV